MHVEKQGVHIKFNHDGPSFKSLTPIRGVIMDEVRQKVKPSLTCIGPTIKKHSTINKKNSGINKDGVGKANGPS